MSKFGNGVSRSSNNNNRTFEQGAWGAGRERLRHRAGAPPALITPWAVARRVEGPAGLSFAGVAPPPALGCAPGGAASAACPPTPFEEKGGGFSFPWTTDSGRLQKDRSARLLRMNRFSISYWYRDFARQLCPLLYQENSDRAERSGFIAITTFFPHEPPW